MIAIEEHTYAVLFHTKFHLDQCIVSAGETRNLKFARFENIQVLFPVKFHRDRCIMPSYHPMGQKLTNFEYKSGSHTESGGNFARGSEPTSSSLFIPNFVLIGVCCVVNERQKLQILAYCQIQIFLVASPSEKIDNRKPSLIQRNQNRS